MNIVVPGGSGEIGTLVSRAFHRQGHDVVVLSRRPIRRPWRVVVWDGATLGDWTAEIDGCDVVVNLAGRSVNCRYTAANRKQIFDSRVVSTRLIGRAIAQARRPPRVWLQASTATIYAHRFDAPNDEASGIIGGNEGGVPSAWTFSIDVARAWERALDDAETPRTRRVALRSAITLSPEPDGVFDTLLALVRRGLGGRAADGRQYVSWIHHEDFVRALQWIVERDDIAGPINVASPNPLPNAEFMRILRRAWGTRVGLPASRWMLELAALAWRTETELILKSRRVVPGRLCEQGFRFGHPHWPGAANDLCRQWRLGRNFGDLDRSGTAAAEPRRAGIR